MFKRFICHLSAPLEILPSPVQVIPPLIAAMWLHIVHTCPSVFGLFESYLITDYDADVAAILVSYVSSDTPVTASSLVMRVSENL